MFDKLPPLKSPSETIDDLNARAKDAAKDASDSLSRMAKPSSMVTGRMICPISANGAPDCKAGADKLCQSKGYKEGKSLNTDSAENLLGESADPGPRRESRAIAGPTITSPARCASSARRSWAGQDASRVRLPYWYDVWHLWPMPPSALHG